MRWEGASRLRVLGGGGGREGEGTKETPMTRGAIVKDGGVCGDAQSSFRGGCEIVSVALA